MNGEIETQTLRAAVEAAIARFNDSMDSDTLLCPLKEDAERQSTEWHAAHERAIAHRLAFYFECALRHRRLLNDQSQLSVDCEYDRHIDDAKKLRTILDHASIIKRAGRTWEELVDEPGVIEFLIKPDIVLHQRRTDDHNLVVIELKKASSREFLAYDDLKLMIFTTQMPPGYNYQLGYAITARDDLEPQQRLLTLDAEYEIHPA
jgi:hypothetical protein